MYCIEGDITTRRLPETLLGEFELVHTDTILDLLGPLEREFKAYGSPQYLEAVRQMLIAEDGISPDASIEPIETVEQAEKHTPPQDRKIAYESRSEPDVIKVIEGIVPGQREVLAGRLALWEEVRKPFRHRYTRAGGRLLELYEFQIGKGWGIVADVPIAGRFVQGQATRSSHDVLIHTVSAEEITRVSPNPLIVVRTRDEHSKDIDGPRHIDISRAVKQMNKGKKLK